MTQKIAILFGERSAEHEISVLTALQIMDALDPLKYEALPVYIDPQGKWYTGEALFNRNFYRNYPHSLSQVEPVALSLDPKKPGLKRLKKLPFWRSLIRPSSCFLDVDAFLLAFHGAYGEDGRLQALLELADVPYTGSNYFSSALAMNKHLSKIVAANQSIPVLPGKKVLRSEVQQNLEQTIEAILNTPGLETFPLFVKPNRLGSSIGIGKVHDRQSLKETLLSAASIDYEILVEPCLQHFLEINCSILDGAPPIASPVEIPTANEEGILTYADKYLKGSGKKGGRKAASSGMANLNRAIDPEHLSPQIKEQVQALALKTFQALGCSGLARLDFMLDLNENQLYFNEINPIPGSLSFYLWQAANPSLLLPEILDRLIALAFEKREKTFEEWHISQWLALKS